MYGLEEPQKARATARKLEDLKKVESVLQSIGAKGDSIRDCVRLVKYKSHDSKPRPVLANLTRVYDVQEVLSKVGCLAIPSPDLPLLQRKIKSILMKEKWSLIRQGQSCSSIKICISKIYVANSLHGSSDGNSFIIASNLNVSSGSLFSIAEGSPPDLLQILHLPLLYQIHQ